MTKQNSKDLKMNRKRDRTGKVRQTISSSKKGLNLSKHALCNEDIKEKKNSDFFKIHVVQPTMKDFLES